MSDKKWLLSSVLLCSIAIWSGYSPDNVDYNPQLATFKFVILFLVWAFSCFAMIIGIKRFVKKTLTPLYSIAFMLFFIQFIYPIVLLSVLYFIGGNAGP
ncbi:hypothetical protein LC085_16970 [Bacillus tianshenii]|uniref:hypothetical protein n=1 Tax=Sutcliffiella tianshenii TaxID=1463404 RepID=UPI001CD25A60|nr:hypothetical protein [Bacillus tianshenii]MCA1321600.1 hypothetical protein [Bacillus tianshenii]